MGFRDAEWAYGLEELSMREKVVLTALCHRTDDRTHQTYVGQQTVANMIGSSPDFVRRGLRELENVGVISRTRRAGAGGYRTSDLITVNTAYLADSPLGATPTRPVAYQADSRDLTGSQPPPTQTTAGAEEITQGDHSEENSDSPAPSLSEVFEQAWKQWPKKADKKAAQQAFKKAAKMRPAEQLALDIVTFGQAYARSVTEIHFVPGLAPWLRGERWNDDLPTPRLSTNSETAARDYHQKYGSRDEQNMAVVAALQEADCENGHHKLTADNTCALCDVRPWQLELPEGANF